MKYIDLIAYPIGVLVVYLLLALLNWDRDPGTWSWSARCVWIIWAIAWGAILQFRIRCTREFS